MAGSLRSVIPSSGGGGSPAGSDGDVQFNTSGAFDADARFNYNKATNQLIIDAATNTEGFKLTGNPNYNFYLSRAGFRVEKASDPTKTQTFQYSTPTGVDTVSFPLGSGTVAYQGYVDSAISILGLNEVTSVGNSTANAITVGGITTPYIYQQLTGSYGQLVEYDNSQYDYLIYYYNTSTNAIPFAVTYNGCWYNSNIIDEGGAFGNSFYRDTAKNGVPCWMDDTGSSFDLVALKASTVFVTTSTFSVSNSHNMLLVDCATAGGNVDITLQDPRRRTNDLIIKLINNNGSAHQATLLAYNVDGVAGYTLTNQMQSIHLRADGSDYWIVAEKL